jgi:hypothetical protein
MSFNRLKYDKCAYDLEIKRSTTPGDYRLFGLFAENCNQCMSFDGPTGSKSDVSVPRKSNEVGFGSMAEIESELSWRNKSVEKCNENKTPINKHKIYHKQTCNNKLTSEDTRFTHPLNNYRSMSLTDYHMEPYLHVNPQCYVQPFVENFGMNTKLQAKDSFKIPKHTFLDNGEALPAKPIDDNKYYNI